MRKIFATFALVMSFAPFFFAAPAFAEKHILEIKKGEPPPASFVANIGDCIATGNCSLCDVLKFFGTIAQWILATVGGLALFFFVLGGFDLLTSGGKQESVEKGKKKITGALIGLLIVLGSYFIINVVLGLALGIKPGEAPEINVGGKKVKWQEIECKPISSP